MSAQVTSFSDLQRYAEGTIIELPQFDEGQPLIVRVKRTSLLALMSKGKIPNSLKVKANELFSGGTATLDADDEDMLGDLNEILEIFAEATLVEPTYAQIKEAGVQLTDDQLMTLFGYSQKGVKALESFRGESGDTGTSTASEGVQ